MNYNIEIAMSATLSAKVVEEMVRKVVEDQTGKKVSKVSFKIGQYIGVREEGYSEFDGCIVTFAKPVANSH